jgi:hypothetical protein
VLFKSAVPLPVDDQKTYGWKRYITGSLEVYSVPGEHGNLTKAPHVCVLAEKLKSCMANDGGLSKTKMSTAKSKKESNIIIFD